MKLEAIKTELGEHKDYRITRDGDLDLAFNGWLLGEGETGYGGEYRCDWKRGVDVSIYLSSTGRLVVAEQHWSRWQGERNSSTATVHETPVDVLAWLREQSEDRIGPASKEAWEEACGTWSGLSDADVERV